MLGTPQLTDLSLGDTATFTAVISLGVEGDPLTPLISADAIAAIHQAGQFLDANRSVVPEPASAGLCLTLLASLAFGARHRR